MRGRGERRLAYQPLIHFYVMGANEKSAAPANFDFIHKLPPATHAFLRTKQGAHARWMPLRSECVIFYLKEREMEEEKLQPARPVERYVTLLSSRPGNEWARNHPSNRHRTPQLQEARDAIVKVRTI